MKQCPKCNQTYSDDQLNFCLNDGELLMQFAAEPSRFADDAPPTILLDQSRVTNPTNWQTSAAQPPAQWQPQNIQQNRPFTAGLTPSQDKTLPTIAMILGILSVALVCCYGGIWLGLPAAILGFIGMRNTDSDPNRYGGRGMAIAGLVLGVVSLLSSLVFAVVMLVSK